MMEFQVNDMNCGHCVKAVTQTVQSLDPQAEVSVDLVSKKVSVQSVESREAIAAALAEAGYPPANVAI
jgi:copper chaperone